MGRSDDLKVGAVSENDAKNLYQLRLRFGMEAMVEVVQQYDCRRIRTEYHGKYPECEQRTAAEMPGLDTVGADEVNKQSVPENPPRVRYEDLTDKIILEGVSEASLPE